MGASALWKITGMEEKDADRRVNGMRNAPAPLFQDPVFEGPTDPTISGDPYSNYPRCRSCIQVAQLTVENDLLTAIRDEPFDFYLPDDGA